jgi:hypothetical protein
MAVSELRRNREDSTFRDPDGNVVLVGTDVSRELRHDQPAGTARP